MKKVIIAFSLLLYTAFSFAQKVAPMSQEQVRLKLAQGMVNFISSVQPAYTKGTTLAQFTSKLCGTWTPTLEGTALINKAYLYISTGYTASSILKSYAGSEMAAAALFYKNLYGKNPKTDGSELFGGATGVYNQFATENPRPQCRWYQLGCLLDWVGSWINDNWGWIAPILQGLGIIK